MNILFFTYDFPYPTTSGGKVRAYNLLKHAKKKENIILFSFTRPDYKTIYKDELEKLAISTIETFPRKKVRDLQNMQTFISNRSLFNVLYFDKKIVQRLHEVVVSEKIDIIHYESLYTAYYADSSFTQQGVKQVYGSENIEYVLYKKYAEQSAPFLLRPGYTIQAKRIQREEERISHTVDALLAVTSAEVTYFNDLTQKPVYEIPNGVDLTQFRFAPRKKVKETIILFVGNFDYFPNIEAVRFFYEQVFSKLEDDSLRFQIVGKKASSLPYVSDPRVLAIDFIDDIRDAYADAAVFVCPIRIGGGTNFKLLEAMAMGVPVVSFSDRVKDIGAKDGHDVLLADEPELFQKHVSTLLSDEAIVHRLTKNARTLIEEKFSWTVIGNELNRAWKEVYEAA